MFAVGATSAIRLVFAGFLVAMLSKMAHSGSIPKKDDNPEDEGAIERLFGDIGTRKRVNFILVMDRSHSMSKEMFYLKLKPMAQAILMQHASLYTTFVRLSIITFAKDISVVVDGISDPDSAPNKCTLFNEEDPIWDKVVYTHDDSQLKGTNMKEAFLRAISIFQKGDSNDPDVSKVLLLLSDGKYNKDYDPVNEAKELMTTHHVTMYAIGLGSWLEHGNVRVVTSKYNGTYLYGTYNSWQNLLKGRDHTKPVPLTSYGSDTPVYLIGCDDENHTNSSLPCYCDIDRGIKSYLCYPGSYYDPANKTCIKCPLNTYKRTQGNDLQCTPCPSDSKTVITGNINKESCNCSSPGCIDPCESSTCNDHQRCVALNETDIECVCLDDWQGENCSVNIDACSNNDKCQHESVCVDGLGADVFTCVCTKWGYKGQYCEIDIDECTNDTCTNNGTCEDRVSNFHCNCPAQWIGRYCQDRNVTTTTQIVTVTVLTTTSQKPNNTLWIIIGACVGGGLLIVIVIAAVAVCISRGRKAKNKQEVKSIAQQFNGFWKKRTLRGSKYIKEMEEDSQAGLPSAPSAHRPDLIESTAVFDELKTDEYAELPCQTMTLKTGMESWHSYISELEMSKVIDRALIVKMGGEKKTMTMAWMFDPDEVFRLGELMVQQDENVPLLLQDAEYHIQENDGTMAIGKTIGSSQEPRVLAIGKTKTYLIVAVALVSTDKGKVRKEVQWIVDHITGEGY